MPVAVAPVCVELCWLDGQRGRRVEATRAYDGGEERDARGSREATSDAGGWMSGLVVELTVRAKPSDSVAFVAVAEKRDTLPGSVAIVPGGRIGG